MTFRGMSGVLIRPSLANTRTDDDSRSNYLINSASVRTIALETSWDGIMIEVV
jgi:hypothetical protein